MIDFSVHRAFYTNITHIEFWADIALHFTPVLLISALRKHKVGVGSISIKKVAAQP